MPVTAMRSPHAEAPVGDCAAAQSFPDRLDEIGYYLPEWSARDASVGVCELVQGAVPVRGSESAAPAMALALGGRASAAREAHYLACSPPPVTRGSSPRRARSIARRRCIARGGRSEYWISARKRASSTSCATRWSARSAITGIGSEGWGERRAARAALREHSHYREVSHYARQLQAVSAARRARPHLHPDL